MHIEINSGGLLGGASINDFQVDLDQFIGASNDILSAFKTVQNTTQNLNGGVGSLREALEQIGERIREEERKIEAAIEVQQKTIEFVALANRVDKQVAELVNQNREEFYRTNPWLRPPQPVEDDRSLFEIGADYLKEGLHQVGEFFRQNWEYAKEAYKQIRDSILEFYKEHKKIIDTIIAGAAIVASVVALISGTGLVVLVPLLTALGVSLETAAAVSAAVMVTGYVVSISSNVLNIMDTWLEIDTPLFNTIQTILSVTSTVFRTIRIIGSLYNLVHPGDLEKVKELIKAKYEHPETPEKVKVKVRK